MEFGQTPRRRKNIKLTGDRHADRYPHGLQFYTVPPVENISLQDFEDLAVDRLKGTFLSSVDEWSSTLEFRF